jgi:hypothetical protein
MAWNRTKAVDYFVSQYSKYNPSQYQFRPNANELTGVHDTELALQKLYMECASAAMEKETLLLKLDYLIKHGAIDPKAHNVEEYKSIIKLEAAEIKREIEIGKLIF